ncbi:LON peptidase substrate-binding domain-containing protein [Prauserella halophila]|uniref:LON peptidase substrate-binding domain-containing protein n=1 Tax=Prauserella halophila TaxID=185641 RepID=A0ABN1W7A6_9PSEU
MNAVADTRPDAPRATLPLFPLQTVLLPGTPLPLHIFEPRYRQLTADLLTGTVPDRLFGVVALRSPLLREVDELDHVHTIGCTARLDEATPLPDGRYDLTTTGVRRFVLHEIDTRAAPYLVGTVSHLDDLPLAGESDDVDGALEAASRLGDLARAAHRRYCDVVWPDEGRRAASPDTESPDTASPDTDPAALSYRLAADCRLPLSDRQALLEQRAPLRRLREVCRLLNREAGFRSLLRAIPASLPDMNDGTGTGTMASPN